MYCLNCKKKVDDGPIICPECNKPLKPERCPECWTKLDGDICSKCGCDIPRYIKEKEEEYTKQKAHASKRDKIKSLPLWIKILVPVLVLAVILGGVLNLYYRDYRRNKEAGALAFEMIEKTDAAIEEISKIASYYEAEVYDMDWLNHVENAAKVREKYKDEIDSVKRSREPIVYANNLVAKTGSKKYPQLCEKLYYCYNECYAYVVGEKGKYPHYLENYNELVEDYKAVRDEINTLIDKK